MTTVTLTNYEILMAANSGVMRRVLAIKLGRVQKNNRGKGGEWEQDILGCQAEMAAAKYLDKFWTGSVGPAIPGDVGPHEVRATGYPNGHLIIHKADAPDTKFILVIRLSDSDYVLPGLAYAKDAQKPEFIKELAGGRPAFCLTQEQLQPMEKFDVPTDAENA